MSQDETTKKKFVWHFIFSILSTLNLQENETKLKKNAKMKNKQDGVF